MVRPVFCEARSLGDGYCETATMLSSTPCWLGWRGVDVIFFSGPIGSLQPRRLMVYRRNGTCATHYTLATLATNEFNNKLRYRNGRSDPIRSNPTLTWRIATKQCLVGLQSTDFPFVMLTIYTVSLYATQTYTVYRCIESSQPLRSNRRRIFERIDGRGRRLVV